MGNISGPRNRDYGSVSGPRNRDYGSTKFLGPETDIMGQFLGPETDIMGERYFMYSTKELRGSRDLSQFETLGFLFQMV